MTEQDLRIWQRPWARRSLFWLALITLMVASTVLEWSRLYRLEALLPGHAGGVLGHGLGAFSMRWLGFTGSALTMLALLLVCLPRVFRFSWGHWAEEVGHTLDGWFEARREKREAVEDQRIGEKAAREREEVVKVERVEIEEHHPTPVVIEPTLVDVPKSERVAKERQKPLFTELPDSKLPQVDLLDSAPVHQAGVDSQTLEMTSRLIEKKLKDFGVDVRVVAAAPGPVITRYEIEPATGVKGSQIVNLGRDLARSLSLVSIRVIETIPGQEPDGAGVAQRQAPDHQAQRDPGLGGLQRRQVHADHGPGQGHRWPAHRGRSGQDAALPGGRHHRFGQVGRHQRDDPVAAVQGRRARRAPAADRSQDAGDECLRRHSAPAWRRWSPT